MIDLLPCPFCGGEPDIQENGRMGFHYWEVVCNAECDFTGPAKDTKEQAAAAWNRRHFTTSEPHQEHRKPNDA